MREFKTIQKLDTAILYTLELVSSVSVILLAFGLVTAMTNVLLKGTVTDNYPMQALYAWTQCIGIDCSIPGAIMRTLFFYRQREWLKAGLYTVLSTLLLFTAAIVSNIEAVQQTLSLTLDNAYLRVFVSVESLIWIRSIAIVLLIVAHAVKHVPAEDHTPVQIDNARTVVNPEALTDSEQKTLPSGENFALVKAYLDDHPNATARETGKALGMSATTANKWMNKVKEQPPENETTSLAEELS
jgi:hypothetical protein